VASAFVCHPPSRQPAPTPNPSPQGGGATRGRR
jgi:hypothetical protein